MTLPLNATIAEIREARRDLVCKMAFDLIRFDAVANEADSIRSLCGAGYSAMDVMMLIDDVRQVAAQAIVARETAIARAQAALRIIPPRTVIGKVSGKVREADQCQGMPHAICHACGLGYKCDDIDCPNDRPNPMFAGGS